MLAKRIIPCLDVKAGRVVKGTNFVFLRDAGDPVELAAQYEREQADELTFLDITASVEGRKAMLDVIERTAREVFMPLTVGGGISTMEDIRAVLMAGADKTSLNTAAVMTPELIQKGPKLMEPSVWSLLLMQRKRHPAAGSAISMAAGRQRDWTSLNGSAKP